MTRFSAVTGLGVSASWTRRLSFGRVCGSALLAAALLWVAPVSASGQGGPPPPDAPRGGAQGRANNAQRALLERRLQDRINQVVRQKLALSDEQFDKLRETASRMEDARRDLRNEEVTTRFAMRQELLAGDKANEARVAELLERMPKLERRRLELMEQEQRELAKFLSATQRARYLGLQDELRRSMQDLQRRRMGLDGEQPPANPRPGARRLQRPPAGVIPPP